MDEPVVRNIATTLHAVFCPKHHDDEILSTLNDKNEMCRWYVETQCEDTWNEPDHMIWLLRAKILIKTLEEEDADAVEFVTLTLKICRLLLDMRSTSEKGEALVIELLGDFYDRE